MKRILLFPFFTLLLSATPAHAWNSFGHMIVAAIAYDQLTPTVRSKTAALLNLNPQYSEWIDGVSASDRDKVAFLKAATWPDYIKHAAGYTNDGESPSNPNVSQNSGYDDRLMHRYWHYIDLPFSPDGTALVQPVPPNAQTQIAAFRATLASHTASNALKSYDLVWLIHLVGDIHQPLHATSRFTKDEPKGDRGGNAVALCAKPCRNELHAFWDDVLGTSTDPEKAIRAPEKMPAVNQRTAAISDESQWIQESLKIAKSDVYTSPVGVGPGPYSLDTDYRTNARRIAKERVAFAGARLAKLINNAIGQ